MVRVPSIETSSKRKLTQNLISHRIKKVGRPFILVIQNRDEPRTEGLECAIENLMRDVEPEFKNETFSLPH